MCSSIVDAFLGEYLRVLVLLTFTVTNSGIHIHVFSQLSARQESLMAYLPGYNLGCPDKRAELIIEKNGKKVECNFNISDQLVISIMVTKKAVCKESSVRQPGRAENNGRSTENVQPDCGLDRSNSGLASHFNQSFLNTNILFSIQLSFCCHLTHSLLEILLKNAF